MAVSEVRESDPLRDPKQAGLILGGVHPKTVLRLAALGELPVVRLGPRTVRFRESDLQAYIDAHRTATAAVGDG